MGRPIKRRVLFIVIFVLFGSTNRERRISADGVRRTPDRARDLAAGAVGEGPVGVHGTFSGGVARIFRVSFVFFAVL